MRATVTLNLAKPPGYPSPPRRTSTDTYGAFSFTHLPANQYVLCAQISSLEPAPADSPFVDTCLWPQAQAPITLTAGQQLTGIVFTAPYGAWLKVRVVDPDHALPQSVPPKGPATLEPELQLLVKGPDRLYRHARFLSNDNAGRNYQAVIPLNTDLGLKANSNVADIFDQGGNQIKGQDEIKSHPNTPADVKPLTLTVHRKKP